MAHVGGPGALRGCGRIGELGRRRLGDRRGISGGQLLAQAIGAGKGLLRGEADNRGVASSELNRASIAATLLLDASALFSLGHGGFYCHLLALFGIVSTGFSGRCDNAMTTIYKAFQVGNAARIGQRWPRFGLNNAGVAQIVAREQGDWWVGTPRPPGPG